MIRLILTSSILALLIFSKAQAVECSAVFTDGLQTHNKSNNVGSISFQNGAELQGSPDNTLDSPNINDNSNSNSCDTQSCISSGNSTQWSSFIDFNGSNDNINVGNNQDRTLVPGEYGNISLGNGSTLRVTEGDYILNGTLQANQNSEIIITSGVVRFFIKQSVSLGNSSEINITGNATQLLIYSEQNIEVNNGNGVVNGFLYSEQSINIQNSSTAQGALTGSQINLQQNSSVEYSNAIPDFGDFCGGDSTTSNYCETNFVNGVTTFDDGDGSGDEGEIRVEKGSSPTIINDSNGLLRTNLLSDDEGDLQCVDVGGAGGSQTCVRDTVNGETQPIADIPFVAGSGGNTINTSSTITLGEGSYNSDTFDVVTINNGGNLTFSTNYSTYYIDSLKVLPDDNNGDSATITLAPGDYYIADFDTFQNTTVLSSGVVRIILQGNIQFAGNTQMNIGGVAEDFLIFNNDDDIYIEDNTEIHGLISSKSTIGLNGNTTEGNARVVGAISAGNRINIGGNSEVYYTCDAYVEPDITPIVDYRFDECEYTGASGEVIDQVGSYNADTNNVPNPVTDAVINRSLNLSNANATPFEWLLLPKESIDNLDDFSISVWVKTDVSKNQQEIIHALGSSTSDDELELAIQNSNEVYFKVSNDPTTLSSSIELTDNDWHHLVVTRQGADTCLYVDGSEEQCKTNSVNDGQLDIDEDAVVIGQEQDSYGGGFNSDQSFDGHLDEFKVFDTVLNGTDISEIYLNESSGKNYDGTDRAEVSCGLEPLALYRFEQTDFSSQIDDSSGNDNHAENLGGVSTATGKYCRGFDSNGYNDSDTIDNAFRAPLDMNDDVGEQGTISFWFNSSVNWNNDVERTLFDASLGSSVADKYFDVEIQADGLLKFSLEDTSDKDVVLVESSNENRLANTWYYLTVTWDMSIDTFKIYVDGDLKGQKTDTSTNGTLGALGDIVFGDNSSDYTQIGLGGGQGGIASPSSSRGSYDEVRIYAQVLSQSEIQADMNESFNCNNLSHFEIDTNGATGLTCEPDLVMIKACADFSCETLYADAVDVVLSVTGSTVTEKKVTVTGGETDVNYIHTTAEVVSLSLDQTYRCDNHSPTPCNVSFSDAGFRFIADTSETTIPVQLSGKPSSVGYKAASLIIEALQNDGSGTGVCSPLLIDDGEIDMAATYQTPTSNPYASQVNISGSTINTAASLTGYTPVLLSFGEGDLQPHQAAYVFTYPDAGAVELHARYQLPDDPEYVGSPTNNFIIGRTSIIVRPLAFDISIDTELDTGAYKNNPAATDASGGDEDVFTTAGSDIRITMRAVAWEDGQDTNSDGVADPNVDLLNNATTKNFTNVTFDSSTSLVSSLVAPTLTEGGILGDFSIVDSGNFSAGIKVDTATYSEVGIISLRALKQDYLATGVNIEGNVPFVGRFTPDHFTVKELVDGEIWSTCDTASPSVSLPFAYSGQMLLDDENLGALSYSSKPGVVLEAKNKGNVRTQNYIDDFMKLTPDSFIRKHIEVTPGIKVYAPFEDAAQPGKDLANNVRIDSLLYDGNFTNEHGVITYSYDNKDNFVYVHEENSEIIEFPADIDLPMLSIIDGDGIATEDKDGDLTNNFIFTLNPTAPVIRFGRAQLKNSYGPDTADLPQILSVNYFTEDGYKLSDTDTCTTYDSANVTLTNIDLAPAKTPLKNNVTGTFSDEDPQGETHDIILTAPTTNITNTNTGQVCVTYDVFPWLQYLWAVDEDNLQCAYSADDVDSLLNDNPHAIATFGLYRGNDRIIYQREISR